MLGMIIITVGTAFAGQKTLVERSVASIREDQRQEHARELLGKHYKKSMKKHENQMDLEKKITALVSKNLPKKFQKKWSSKVKDAILAESMKHGLDPLFVSAVIAGESSFNPDAKGPVGEIGLMQLRPATAAWISKKLGKKWMGDESLKNPVTNIELGTAYLSWLREKCEGQSQLYVAAYNMGLTNVKRAVKKDIWPKDYPLHVMKRYLAFYKEEQVTKKIVAVH